VAQTRSPQGRSPIRPRGLPGPASRRANAALILGILSVLACFAAPATGIPAWIIGRTELRDIEQGFSAELGRSAASTGSLLGVVAMGLWTVGLIVYVLIRVFSS
jgi:hypothetical protein